MTGYTAPTSRRQAKLGMWGGSLKSGASAPQVKAFDFSRMPPLQAAQDEQRSGTRGISGW